jgi:hypothetical protein
MRIESKKYLYHVSRAAALPLQLEIVGEALAQLARIDPVISAQPSRVNSGNSGFK